MAQDFKYTTQPAAERLAAQQQAEAETEQTGEETTTAEDEEQ